MEILNELSDYIETSDTPRETVLLVLGFVTGVALRSGWTFRELVALRLWPKPSSTPEG